MRPALPVRLWCWNGWSDTWFAASSKARQSICVVCGTFQGPSPPHGNLADCSKRCKSFVGDDACCPACWAYGNHLHSRQIESQCFLPHRFMIKIKPPAYTVNRTHCSISREVLLWKCTEVKCFTQISARWLGRSRGNQAGTYHSERYRQPAQPHRDRCRHHQQAG